MDVKLSSLIADVIFATILDFYLIVLHSTYPQNPYLGACNASEAVVLDIIVAFLQVEAILVAILDMYLTFF